MRISLLITTYNAERALELVLASVRGQVRLPDEVIVADDGSGRATAALVARVAHDFPVPLRHAWQEDAGFRLARARNLGLACAAGDFVVMIDGDMVLHRRFVADHARFAAPGRFLQGGRLRATARETARLCAGGRPRFSPFMDGEFRTRFDFRRHHAFRCLPLAWLEARARRSRTLGCHLGFWREDAVRVNGFNEAMEGYGSEDLEFVARLRHAGVADRRLRYCALAIHLHHASRAPADPDDLSMPNNRVLRATRDGRLVRCARGLDAHTRNPRDIGPGAAHVASAPTNAAP